MRNLVRLAGRGVRWLVFLGVLGLIGCFVAIVVSAQIFAGRGLDTIAQDGAAADADVIIVLSAGLNRDQDLDPFSAGRVATGVALWRAGAAPNLLMSGGFQDQEGNHLAEVMKARAIALGVPEAAIGVEGVSISTFENTRFTLAVARQENWRRAIVVSDDFHLLRAWALFAFWAGANDLEIVSLAASPARAEQPVSIVLLLLLRETLAYPFNMLKMTGQMGLDLIGEGSGRTIR